MLKSLTIKLQDIRDEIIDFDGECIQSEYTDTDKVWEMLNRWRDELTEIIGDSHELWGRICTECKAPLVDTGEQGHKQCPRCDWDLQDIEG